MIVAIASVALVAGAVVPAAAAGSKITDTNYGFPFSVPRHWQEIPLNGNDVTGLLDLLTKTDPRLKAGLGTKVAKAAKQGVKLLVVGPVLHYYNPTVNVIVVSPAGPPSRTTYFNELGISVKLELTSAGFKNVKTTNVTLPIGKEIEATYTLTTKPSPQKDQGVQLYIRHKTHFFIVSCTSSSTSDATSIAQQVGRNWHWT